MIKTTQAYQEMDPVAQRIANMSENKKKILHNVQLRKNLGHEKWEALNTNIPHPWKKIVIELSEKQ